MFSMACSSNDRVPQCGPSTSKRRATISLKVVIIMKTFVFCNSFHVINNVLLSYGRTVLRAVVFSLSCLGNSQQIKNV